MLPNDVMCAPSLSSFKSRLKTYLLRSANKDLTVSLITVHMCMVRLVMALLMVILIDASMCTKKSQIN